MMLRRFSNALVLLIVLVCARRGAAQETLPAPVRAEIDKAVREVLAASGAPSASIALVKDGRMAYSQAYGTANVERRTPATPAMRYSIGSISKQFTAAAVLILAEEGRLSLDDPVARWLPDLTRAREVTLRQLLSMTSGYQDFWPQDYVMPGMLLPVTPQEILAGWAKKPLDFDPGTKWQYSNTNYVIAGQIVEKTAGRPLVEFLRERVFAPLGMASVADTDQGPLGPEDPARYMRYALGPPRPAPKEGRGWMAAAGELAMTPSDLARWDVSMIDETVLKPASYRQMETEVLLANGAGTRYGLGVTVSLSDGRRTVSHGGEVSGFTASNQVFPDDRAAVVVCTNLDATSAPEQIASRLVPLLFAASGSGAAAVVDQARRIFEGLQHGTIDRSLLTANASAYFTAHALADFAASLGPLGAPTEVTQLSQGLRGGMTLRRFRIKSGGKTLRVTTFAMPDGRLEQYLVAPAE